MYFLQITEDVSHRPLQKFLAVGRECIFPYQSESNMREMEAICLSKEGLKPFSCICSAVFCISFYCFFLSFHTQITSRLTMLTWGWHSSTVQFSSHFLVRQYPDAISTPGTCMSYTPSCFWESLTGFPYFKFFSLKMFLASGLSAADQHLHGKQQKSTPPHTILVWARCWNMRV